MNFIIKNYIQFGAVVILSGILFKIGVINESMSIQLLIYRLLGALVFGVQLALGFLVLILTVKYLFFINKSTAALDINPLLIKQRINVINFKRSK